MNDFGTGQKILVWITLGLAVVFIIIGIGVLSGAFFPGNIFLDDTMRMVLGFVLIGYGIVRIGMIGRRLKSEKRRNPFAKNP
jgi:hypothetical protein